MNECNQFDSNFADSVADLCYKKFASLPKSGKPIPGKQWTLLAAIVECANDHMQIVSIATGSKCLGRSKMNYKGDTISDSHAEVLARRAFMRYLYEEIRSMKQNGISRILIGNQDCNNYELKAGVSFHLFTSHVPCGDASIFPKRSYEATSNVFLKSRDVHKRSLSLDGEIVKKIKFENEPCVANRTKLENIGSVVSDINRTGAKCLPHDIKQDKKQPGVDYHIVGVVRTKPGRGDPTLSVSCSDKILRWNYVGIEGALLSIFFSRPIYLSSIVVASHPTLYCKDALTRALVSRNERLKDLGNSPCLLHSRREFEFCKRRSHSNMKPSPCSIIWCNVSEKNHEVCVEGRRLGCTKKRNDVIEPLLITRKIFLQLFKSLTGGEYDDLTYYEVKLLALRYRELSKLLKNAVGIWTIKNDNVQLFK